MEGPQVNEPASRYSVFETLRDGTRIEVRAQRPEDRADLLDAFGRMGAESRYYRFFSPKRGFSEAEIAHFMDADFVNHVALVAVAGTARAGQIVGAGRYFVLGPGEAEIAFGVDEAWQGRGIAPAVFRHLVAIARMAGIKALHADVLSDNTPMLKVFERGGLEMQRKNEDGAVHVTLRLSA